MNETYEPNAVREIHEIRLASYERTKNMTSKERCEFMHNETKDLIQKLGIKVLPLESEVTRKRKIN